MIVHDPVGWTSTVKEFTENSAVCSRWMYAAPTAHRPADLDVPVDSLEARPR